MIHAAAIGPGDAVYSVMRGGGVARVVANAADRAVTLYETADKLDALWVSPAGTIHTVGKRYHTNRGGEWRASKLPMAAFSMWGASDDDVFVGGIDGTVIRGREGTWTTIAELGDLVTSIHGTSASSVYIAGFGFLRHFDGSTLHERALAGDRTPHLQGVVGIGSATWFCTTSDVWVADGGEARKIASTNDEIYGVGIGSGGVFVHSGVELYRVEGDRLAIYRDNEDKALMVKRATYSTAITSNGRRVVAGGARSVLVDDGAGFVEWPGPSASAPSIASKKPAKAKKASR